MTKILIIRLSSIGDIVLTTPVVRNLQQNGPKDLELHFIVKEAYKGIVTANPYVDKVWTVRDNVNEVLSDLIKEKFDYVIDLHNNMRSIKLKNKIKAESSTVDKLNIQKWILVNTGYNLMKDSHIVDRYMACLNHFKIENDGKGLDFFIPPIDEVSLREISNTLTPNRYIAWAIGATYKGKRMSKEKNVSVLNKIKFPVVLIGGKVDIDNAKYIHENTGNHVFNTVGKYNLNQSASIVEQSRLVVTPDTGMMHIAAAFDKNIISIWGCTTPSLGMSPYMPGIKSVSIEPENLKRRPCSKLGNRCNYKGGCINRISEDDLIHNIAWIYNF